MIVFINFLNLGVGIMKGINKLEVNKEFFFFGDFDEFVVLILFGLKVNRNK